MGLGSIVSGSGTQDALESLKRDPSVVSIDASRRADVIGCGRSVPHIHADVVTGPPIGEDGGGSALIGLIDMGVDVLHQVFLDGKGVSRIVEIWDQMDQAGP